MKPFLDALKRAGEEISRGKFFRVISHFDADGICSAAIMSKTLQRLGIGFHLSIVEGVDEELVKRLKEEPYERYIFTDLGSGQLELINKMGKRAWILDHHQIQGEPNENITLLNPLSFSLPPFSGSTVTYLFSRQFDNLDLAPLAVIGARGDRQEPIKEVLEDAKVEVREDIRIFGKYLRPLYQALALSTDPFIPGIFSDEGAAVEFLKAIGLDPEKKISELSEEEKKKLVAGIVLRRKGLEKPEDIFGKCYYLKDFGMDADEFSTVINAFSRLGYTGKALSLCFNPKMNIEPVMKEYRAELARLMEKVNENKREGENTVFIFGDNPRMIGTVASILLTEVQKENVVGFAPKGDWVKVSARTKGNNNLGELLAEVTKEVGGLGGGHKEAGGALIPRGKEEEFIRAWENILNGRLNW